jgi:hypothetical protein
MKKSNYNICDYHYEIINDAKELQRLRVEHFDSIESVIKYVDCISSRIEINTENATECGISMENRLREYRDSIESLGFVRQK